MYIDDSDSSMGGYSSKTFLTKGGDDNYSCDKNHDEQKRHQKKKKPIVYITWRVRMKVMCIPCKIISYIYVDMVRLSTIYDE